MLVRDGLKGMIEQAGEEFLFDVRSPSSVKPANYLASRDTHVDPDAGVPIKPVFGLMGWRRPRLGGRAPARLQLASRQPAPELAASHNSCLFPFKATPLVGDDS